MMSLTNKSVIAAFDVDPQQGFTPLCPDELPVPGGDQIVDALNQQASLACIRVASKDAHPANALWVADAEHPMLTPIEGANMDVRWQRHCVPGTPGFAFLPGLPADDYDFVVYKGVEPDYHPYGACYHDLHDRRSTGVIEFLRANGIEVVIVGGLATDYCVATTARQLHQAGFAVIVNLAACRGIAPETTQQAINAMRHLGIQVVDDINALSAAA